MDATQAAITLLGGGTLGAILTSLVNAGIKFFTGKAGREKARNADMRTQRNEAWADAERERARADAAQERADREARKRRKISEYASALRSDLIGQGVPPEQVRPWPQLNDN
ncbi:hypothetical protein [Glutamicibacter creatinolyticus]|uniref:hypothetical protein n=1 Tax=Glutamicibacter creatinolyticus TaxID=162496 RepID=UPI0031E32BA2